MEKEFDKKRGYRCRMEMERWRCGVVLLVDSQPNFFPLTTAKLEAKANVILFVRHETM